MITPTTPKTWPARALTCRRAHGLARLMRNDSAAAAVEAALVLPLLLLMTLGVIEMGRLLFTYHTISQGAMEGVRYAIVRGATSDAPAARDGIVEFVKGRIAGINPGEVAVAVTWNPDNWPGSSVTVQVDYDFDFLALNLAPVTLSRASTKVISR